MILLTRLGGQPMALNPDLIEKAEATPDTVITMVDGHKLVISESVMEVVERIRAWRASVAAAAFDLSNVTPAVPDAVPDAGPGAAPDAVSGRALPQTSLAANGGPPLARVLRMPAREE